MEIVGSLQQKRNRWYIAYRIDGGKLQWKTTGVEVGKSKKERDKSKDLATKVKLDFFQALETQKTVEVEQRKNPYFTDFLTDWIARESSYVKPSTLEGYQKMSRKVMLYFKRYDFKINELSPARFEDFFIYLKDFGREKSPGGLSEKSIKNIKTFLSCAISSAVNEGYIDTNVVLKAKIPKFDQIAGEDDSHVVYSEEELSKLLVCAANADPATKLFIYLAAVTGARRGELLGLTWDDVNFDEKSIFIRRNRTSTSKETLVDLSTPKTKSSNRIICLPESVFALLVDEKKRQDENRVLFGNEYTEYNTDFIIRYENGQIPYPSSVTRSVKKVMEKAGLPIIRVHDIRHSVATLLFNSDVSLKDVSTQLGHSTTAITEKIYIHKQNFTTLSSTNLLADKMGLNQVC